MLYIMKSQANRNFWSTSHQDTEVKARYILSITEQTKEQANVINIIIFIQGI